MAIQTREYANLSLQLKIFAWMLYFFAMLFLVFGATNARLGIFFIGTGIVLAGSVLHLVGWGLGSYKPWAWYAAVIVLVPLSLLLAIMMFLYGRFLFVQASTWVHAVLGVSMLSAGLIYFPYVLWILLSRGGKKRYQDTCDAMKRIKERPDSPASRFYR